MFTVSFFIAPSYFQQPVSIFSVKGSLRSVLREKNGIMWEKFPSGGPPPHTPPVWEFSHFLPFFLIFIFLPFYKPLNWKKLRKIWSGSDPPPVWELFPHNPVFLSENVPYTHTSFQVDRSFLRPQSTAPPGPSGSNTPSSPPQPCLWQDVNLSCFFEKFCEYWFYRNASSRIKSARLKSAILILNL